MELQILNNNNMKNIFLTLLMAISLQAQTVKIAAAGNLRFVLDDIKEKYTQLTTKL